MRARRGAERAGRGAQASAAVALALVLGLAGCRRAALPEGGSGAERLYAARCGQCHAAYDPRSLTAATWEIKVAAMEERMERAGIPALSADERRTILDYLRRNAGKQ